MPREKEKEMNIESPSILPRRSRSAHLLDKIEASRERQREIEREREREEIKWRLTHER